MARKVLVIGAQGVVGSFIARALRDVGWDVLRAGRRPEDGDDFRVVDLERQESVDRACAEADLVVSSVHHPRLSAERSALRQGRVLLHLDDLGSDERKQLAWEVPDPPGLVVDRSGLGGVTGMALAELLEEHPEADEGEFGLVMSAAERAGPGGGLFARRLLHGPAHHATAVVELPQPFGRRRCLEAAPDAAQQIVGDIVGERRVRLLVCLHPRPFAAFFLALNELRALSRLPERAYTVGRATVPDELSSQRTCHWAKVRRDGQVLDTTFVCCDGDYRSTVKATAVYADALVPEKDCEPPRTGVHGLEQLFALDALGPALAKLGIGIRRQRVRPEAAGGPPAGPPSSSSLSRRSV